MKPQIDCGGGFCWGASGLVRGAFRDPRPATGFAWLLTATILLTVLLYSGSPMA